jgi:hypothetical protein
MLIRLGEVYKAAGEGDEGFVKKDEDEVTQGNTELFLVISEDDTP